MKKRQKCFFLFLLLIGFFFQTSKTEAALTDVTTLPFGGLVSYTVACTCPATLGSLWISFAPLYLGLDSPAVGSLVYVPYASQLYPWYMIGVPSTYHLGNYIPGVQACWMVLPPPAVGCAPLPSAGVIFQVGTSKPI